MIFYSTFTKGNDIMEDLMQKMMDEALRLGASHVELRYQQDRSLSHLLKNGVPEINSSNISSGIGIRVLVDGALGFGAGNNLSSSSMLETVSRTVRNARSSASMRSKPIQFSPEQSHRVHYSVEQKKPFADLELSEKMSYLKDVDALAVEAVQGKGAKLPGRFLELETLETEKLIITSEGTRVESIVPRSMMYMVLTASKDSRGSAQRNISRGGCGGWETVESWDLPTTAQEEGKILAQVLDNDQKLEAGKWDIILGPEVVGLVAHESSGHPAEADRISGREAAQAGETYLDRESRSRRVGSDVVNVIDDPTLPGSFGYYLYDDEGVPAKPRYLIRAGVIDEFLHNRETAAEMSTFSNGSSRSLAFNREPIVRMANTFVDRGDHSLEELVEGVHRGVMIKNFMEWNIDDRRYNQRYVGLEAYIIKDGEIQGLVRNPALEITTPALWSAVDAVGDELQFDSAFCGKGDPMQGIPVWTGGPYLRLRDISMGGSL